MKEFEAQALQKMVEKLAESYQTVNSVALTVQYSDGITDTFHFGGDNAGTRMEFSVTNASVNILKDILHLQTQQINQMKNCNNCKYGNDFDAPLCNMDCDECSKWVWDGEDDQEPEEETT